MKLSLLAIITVFFASCKKDLNLDPISVPTSEFTVNVRENRISKDFNATIGADGEVLGGEMDDVTVTAWNEIKLVMTSDDKNFRGVNVRSDNPKIVFYERIDNKTYRLIYKSDGETALTVYAGDKKVRFNVKAKKYIGVIGIIVNVEGKEYIQKFSTGRVEGNNFYTSASTISPGIAVSKEGERFVPVTIVGLYPKNCSCRQILAEINTSYKEQSYTKKLKVPEECRDKWTWFKEDELPDISDDSRYYQLPITDFSFLENRTLFLDRKDPEKSFFLKVIIPDFYRTKEDYDPHFIKPIYVGTYIKID